MNHVLQAIDKVLDRHLETVDGQTFLSSRLLTDGALQFSSSEAKDVIVGELFSEVALELLSQQGDN